LAEQARAVAPDDANQQVIYMLRSASLSMLRGQADMSQTVAGYEYLLAANPHAVNIRAVLSSAYATLGRHDAARHELDVVFADDFAAIPDDINWLPTMALLADAVVRLDDAQRARLLYDRLLPHADAFFFFGVETTPGGAVAMWLGDLAVVLGELERASFLFERAQAIHAALGMTMLSHCGTLGRARLLLATGSASAQPTAARLIAQVWRFAQERGLVWLRGCAEQLAAKVNAPLDDADLTQN